MDAEITPVEEHTSRVNNRIRQVAWMVIGLLVIFLLGLGSGYLKWDKMKRLKPGSKKS
jgi:hypothetical protein